MQAGDATAEARALAWAELRHLSAAGAEGKEELFATPGAMAALRQTLLAAGKDGADEGAVEAAVVAAGVLRNLSAHTRLRVELCAPALGLLDCLAPLINSNSNSFFRKKFARVLLLPQVRVSRSSSASSLSFFRKFARVSPQVRSRSS